MTQNFALIMENIKIAAEIAVSWIRLSISSTVYVMNTDNEQIMRAVTYSKYGPPDVLGISRVTKPAPKDNELLIKVKAVEVTKSDCEMRSFRYSVKWFWLPLRLAFGIFRPRRQILGSYFAGEIVAMGNDVSGFEIGQAILGTTQIRLGAYAEYLVLPADYTLLPKPAALRFSDAAAVLLGGLNAIHFLNAANIKAGEKVLINGAGGSIGAHAVQIAKARGAEVTVVDKAIKKEFLTRMGADHFVDYQKDDFIESDQRYSVVFDMVPSSSYRGCIKLLNPGGRYLTGNPTLSTMLQCMLTNRFTDKSATFAFARETRAELQELLDLIERKELFSIVDRVVPMEQIAEAHHLVESEERHGAIVLAL